MPNTGVQVTATRRSRHTQIHARLRVPSVLAGLGVSFGSRITRAILAVTPPHINLRPGWIARSGLLRVHQDEGDPAGLACGSPRRGWSPAARPRRPLEMDFAVVEQHVDLAGQDDRVIE